MTGFSVAATAYDRFVGRYGTDLAEQLCDAAGIVAPMRALDVGCGPGALTAVLVERLGRGAVVAVDPSDPFVDACRERVPGADVRKAAAEALPFADEEFDAVLSQLVVNFLSDAAGGLAEMRRVARPGAVIAAAVWDYAGEMTMLRRFWDAAAEVSAGAAERDEGRVMRHCTQDTLAELWRSAGLKEVAVQPLTVSADYEGFEDLWAPFTSGVGPAGAFVSSLDEEARESLRSAYRRHLGVGDGPFTLTARAWCAVGRSLSPASSARGLASLRRR